MGSAAAPGRRIITAQPYNQYHTQVRLPDQQKLLGFFTFYSYIKEKENEYSTIHSRFTLWP
jgi:hypothetical protein